MTGARVLVVDDQPANVETRRLHQRLSDRNRDLEIRVSERTEQLERTRLEILERLAIAAEFRDDDTGEQVHRVAHSSALLAGGLGLRPEEVELIRRSSTLHDIGKIGIPDAILLKPGKLPAGCRRRGRDRIPVGETVRPRGRRRPPRRDPKRSGELTTRRA